MLHAAVFSDGQVPACRLQIFLALVVALAGFQALGGRLVRGGHRTVAGDVFLGALSSNDLQLGELDIVDWSVEVSVRATTAQF